MPENQGFGTLGVLSSLEAKLKEMGIINPTEIQVRAIPSVLQGRNVLVQAPTGTGKTLAYLLPLLSQVNNETKDLEVIVLAPSRELAAQVHKVLLDLVPEIKTAMLLGGVHAGRQLENLKEKPKLIVGTPGRIREMFNMRKINGQTVKAIVIDEADKMLDTGFKDDVLSVLKSTLKTRQVIFVSATIPAAVKELTDHLGLAPDYIGVQGTSQTPDTISHLYFMAEKVKRLSLLVKILSIYQPKRALIFIQRNEGVNPLVRHLQEEGMLAAGLQSDIAQRNRKLTLDQFRQGKAQLLVTTDLLARGLDVAGVDMVINYDPPLDAQRYLHRVGRTGRAGQPGTAVSLVGEEQKFIIHKFSRQLHINMIQMGLSENKAFPVNYKRG